jgi:Family of unknown function (DUF6636)
MKRLSIPFAIGLTALLLLLVPGSASAANFKQFATPSGNIGCIMGGGAVRCDIREKSWQAPPKPSWCDVDWGYGVAVGRKGRASFVCAGDTVFEPGEPVLGYGERQIKNRFRCTSKRKGMRCVNTKNKHGFFLSRQSVRVF